MFSTLLKPKGFFVLGLSTVLVLGASVARASDGGGSCDQFHEALNAGDMQPRTADLACRHSACADACYWAGEYIESAAEAESDENTAANLRRSAFETYYATGCQLNHGPSCAKLGQTAATDSELQTAAAEEAEAFRETCSSDRLYFLHYDCACLSQEYEAERLERGPQEHESGIILAINKKCADAEEAKKELIASCLDASLTSEDPPNEEFCTCYGETYQRIWDEAGLAGSSRNYTAVRTQAMTACQ